MTACLHDSLRPMPDLQKSFKTNFFFEVLIQLKKKKSLFLDNYFSSPTLQVASSCRKVHTCFYTFKHSHLPDKFQSSLPHSESPLAHLWNLVTSYGLLRIWLAWPWQGSETAIANETPYYCTLKQVNHNKPPTSFLFHFTLFLDIIQEWLMNSKLLSFWFCIWNYTSPNENKPEETQCSPNAQKGQPGLNGLKF